MTLDFVGFINDNVTVLDAEQKQAMLADFCESFGYVAEDDRRRYANLKIENYIKECVNRARSKRAANRIERLSFEEQIHDPLPD